ncbi:hypothetical protein [Antarcticimicrobium sediminis]|uniref:Strictosidine synthase n=1 Tax=Antarcticimicrobium sediminis TaxID=2546227 RepID=A0A4V2Z850_9RHOB|nr:hypothetical protein [Antarcticimicrobium sediminis]TDE38916.1 hypothetical protein E1B25_07800 [Antarcticimicrobium sediminis]
MIFDPILELFRGRAITIPPMDGAFRPNAVLDETPVLAELPQADNLCALGDRLLASSGTALIEIRADAAPETVQSFASPITALAAAPDCTLTIALEDGTLSENGTPVSLPKGVTCITALAYGPDGALWLANGSDRHPVSGWVADLMEKNADGSVWRRAPGAGFKVMAKKLAWPFGLLPDAKGCLVSESWRHQLVRVEGSTVKPVLRHLPGYPARLAASADGGAWLAIFAPRNRLIEMVLQETHYRFDMMASVPRDYWIAPAFASGESFLEPLQCGGIRTMGVHKAWSPSRSCGLVVRLAPDMTPTFSLHSRANGKRHGTCSVIEHQGRAVIAARGGNCILTAEDRT